MVIKNHIFKFITQSRSVYNSVSSFFGNSVIMKEFQCFICGKEFDNVDSMSHHQYGVHSTEELKCNQCNKKLLGKKIWQLIWIHTRKYFVLFVKKIFLKILRTVINDFNLHQLRKIKQLKRSKMIHNRVKRKTRKKKSWSEVHY